MQSLPTKSKSGLEATATQRSTVLCTYICSTRINERGNMKRVYFYIGLAALLFGTMEVTLKVAGAGIDAFQLTFLRFLIGGLALLPFAILEGRKSKITITAKDLGWLTLLGILCIPISMVFFQLGIEYSNAATAAVLFCTNPLFTMVLAHFFLGEKMNGYKKTAFILAFIGIFFMMRPWDIQEGNTLIGMTFSLVGSLVFSIYTVMGKKSIKRLGIMIQTSISFFIGSAFLLLVIILMGKPIIENVQGNIALIAYVGIAVTGIGYLSFFQAIKYSDATTGSIAFLIKPAIAPIIAVIVLQEVLPWNTIIGIIIILMASMINLNENRKMNRRNERN